MYTYKFTLDRVIDGDTVDGFIDLGFNITVKKRIRLYGIDAPETRTKDAQEKVKGLEAKEWLISTLTNKEIILVTQRDTSGKYGRVLGTLYVNSVNINNTMLQKGLAEIYKE